MAAFNDNAGHNWIIKFDGVLLGDLRDTHGINLADIGGESWLAIETDQTALTKVILFLCRQQMEAEGVTQPQMANVLSGDVAESALQALWGAAKVFFRPKLWSVLRSAYAQRMEAREQWAALAPMMALLNQPEMPDSMRQAVMEQLTAMMEAMSSGSPESKERPSASGPAATPLKPATGTPALAVSNPAA